MLLPQPNYVFFPKPHQAATGKRTQLMKLRLDHTSFNHHRHVHIPTQDYLAVLLPILPVLSLHFDFNYTRVKFHDWTKTNVGLGHRVWGGHHLISSSMLRPQSSFTSAFSMTPTAQLCCFVTVSVVTHSHWQISVQRQTDRQKDIKHMEKYSKLSLWEFLL